MPVCANEAQRLAGMRLKRVHQRNAGAMHIARFIR
jgi:hypothetical protein